MWKFYVNRKKSKIKKICPKANKIEKTSTKTNRKKRNKNEKNTLKFLKDRPKIEDPPPLLNSNENSNNPNNSIINSKYSPTKKALSIHKNLKSQTKIFGNIDILQLKSYFRKNNNNIKDTYQEESYSPNSIKNSIT